MCKKMLFLWWQTLIDFLLGLPEALFLVPPLRTWFCRPARGDGRSAVVTGAASGIGRSTALALAKLGWQVIAADINEPLLADLSRIENISTIVLDVSSSESCEALAALVTRRFPLGLSALCNIAGVCTSAPLLSLSDQELERTIAINAMGPIRLMRLLLPSLLKGGKSCPGILLNVSSTVGMEPWPWTGAYSTSKHALEGATKSVRREAIASGLPLHVVLVEPGPVQTPMTLSLSAGAGLRWCDRNAGSVWEPALRRSSKFANDAFKRGFMASSYRLGYTADEVAEVRLFMCKYSMM